MEQEALKMKFLCGGFQEPVREKLHTDTQCFAHLDTDMVLVKESTRRKRGSAVPVPPKRRHANGSYVRGDESKLA